MFFPIRTDRQLKSTPWVNYSLIAINVAVYFFTWNSTQQFDVDLSSGYSPLESFDRTPGVAYWLWPDAERISVVQFITYQFLHSAPERAPILGILMPLHLIFNMLFLYVFGNAVEDRLGKVGYLGFYLAGGVLAGLAHVLTSGAPVLGASGSVAAVTGIYLALFPLSNVTIAYWLLVFIGSFVVSSMVLILFRVVLDVIFQFTGYGNTAYVAHLAGYLYGFVIGMGLLVSRLLPRDHYDMLALIKQQRRKQQFRKLSRRGFQPWKYHEAGASGAVGDKKQASAPSAADQAIMQKRSAVSDAVARQDLPAAALLYTKLLEEHPEQVMPQQAQLDLANQLAADGQHAAAAQAYELFLATFRDYAGRSQIQLILGLIYANSLKQPGRARELLTDVREKLPPDEQALADRALAQIG